MDLGFDVVAPKRNRAGTTKLDAARWEHNRIEVVEGAPEQVNGRKNELTGHSHQQAFSFGPACPG
jgi:hypothetical protein